MGGIIGITVRYSDGEELRESCWTNVLPEGVFDWRFWVKDESEQHVREFMGRLLENRRKDKQIRSLWGNWHKLAPVEYGQIIIDYQKPVVWHSQGYCGVDHDHVTSLDHEGMKKFLELHARGLVTDIEGTDARRAGRATDAQKVVDDVKRVYHWMAEHARVSDAVGLHGHTVLDAQPARPPVDLGMIEYRIKSWMPVRGGMEDAMRDVYDYARANFRLTPAEKRVWTKWFKEWEE